MVDVKGNHSRMTKSIEQDFPGSDPISITF